EALQGRCKILARRLIVVSGRPALCFLGGCRGGSLVRLGLRLMGQVWLGCRRFCFGCDGAVGFGVVGGGVVEQGHASLLKPRTSVRGGCGVCLADCWSESFRLWWAHPGE